ncbi:MAG: hypothetical protein R3228_02135 [Halioglobus sp.]|nr:hypothetical protein [Halioglobus sp.]
MRKSHSLILALFLLLGGAVACAPLGGDGCEGAACTGEAFTVAVIPDTQNMLDYLHQSDATTHTGEQFPINASEQFLGMMAHIADNAVGAGGDIVFAAAVGDVWQHQTELLDEDHAARGFRHDPNALIAMSGEVHATEATRSFEMPLAVKGYEQLAAAGLPFGVAPGNHDYDAMWADASFPGDPTRIAELRGMDPEILGMLHIGGLDNFRTVFGAQSAFFADKPWYVDSFNGGANAAQLFTGGGYRFLHITLQMQAPDEVFDWARSVLERYPGLPTILTTHDYLDTNGERRANPIVDLVRLDPEHHNSAEALYRKLVHPNDQVFLVLCGHHHGQSFRVDRNAAGNEVYQVLADYQDRGQSVLDASAGLKNRHGRYYGTGDGWLRLMRFELEGDNPRVRVFTYSSHYGAYSGDIEQYADWYRPREQPRMTDAQFREADRFDIPLPDFRRRFGPAASRAGPHPRAD